MDLSRRQIATAVKFWSDLILERRPDMRADVRERFEERLGKFLTGPPKGLRFDGVHLGVEVTPEPILALSAEQAGIAIVGHSLWPGWTATRFIDDGVDGVEVQRGQGAPWVPLALVEDDG